MNNEFEFEAEDLDFGSEETAGEDFAGEIEDLDDLGLEEIETRTAVLAKNNMIALLCLKTAEQGAAICRVDPREDRPAVQLYDDADKALEWFTKSLRTSKQNGWQVVYDGLPLQG
jgi:hypothetical protein